MCRDIVSSPSRRAVLTGGTAAGLGGLVLGTAGSATAAGAGEDAEVLATQATHRRPQVGPQQFTLAVMPDTQYLFDDAAIHPEPVVSSLAYLHAERDRQGIAFLAHLGDLTQNGAQQEIDAISRAWDRLRGSRIPFATLAGNHDVGSRTDDQRGSSPYLSRFRPRVGQPGVVAVSPDGYNSVHTFTGAGRQWLLLSLDWRLSAQGFAWAAGVLAAYRHLPTILTTHEMVSADTGDGAGILSDYGRTLWDRLVKDHDQVFLTVNGHFWPSGRLVQRNAAGHEVHCHLANYQERYYGGAAMMRLYRFDLARGVIDVETLAPWVQQLDPARRGKLMQEELVVTGPLDRFTVEIDFDERFRGFAPAPVRPARPAAQLLVPGTLAYWRWDGSGGGTLARGSRVRDLSGHGNDLEVVAQGSTPVRLDPGFHPDQPGHGSIRLGGTDAKDGDHLRTVDGAPLNAETFERGYTVEAFFRLPDTWTGRDAWTALLSRQGTAKAAGKKPGDPDEPVVTLSLSGDRELQWCVCPHSLDTSLTSWGHELRLDRWWHVAVVNDTRHTTMYVEGCPVVRNPATANRGLTTLGKRWLVGGYEYADVLDTVFRGGLGDLRVVGRPLAPREFLNA
ncbi:LamG-like jellyroll fold domain-containing protein [Arsenicicoccus dermatophilus]|uniref:LamG-like jellyroll fold domain-containing protein n=1 Tax=Arsenicicoccus dermatophilus TaxID=1076331 RepID=UPI001F4CDBED|nr:LamG-like jellyroll fold domain-containing protein [Arsenicicoccus dermatophilus]MCH8613373.1 metallophosphoesterase [Arsenicicoccus dermatophilus]